MRTRWLTLLRRIGGTIVFVAGVVALALPVIPGWMLIAFGLYLLSIDSPGMQRRVVVLRTRHILLDRLFKPLDRFLGHESESYDEVRHDERDASQHDTSVDVVR